MEQNRFDHVTQQSAGADCMAPLSLDTIQVNIGLRCNLACHHCHVASSPRRTEEMNWETLQQILDAAKSVSCRLVDITGGAPEMNPHFRRFITALRKQGQQVQVRTNLTIHLEKDEGMEGMLEFFRDNQVQLVASLPCYTIENVDGQRGEGVYEDSVTVLKKLNALGYGIDPDLPLNLVYNPGGPSLPPDQAALEVEYHKQLRERFGIEFHNLFAITNVPIGRFIRDLRMQNKAESYQQLLIDSFNVSTLDGLMCRNQISIDWDGNLYDCDFNLALKKTINHGAPTHISDFNAEALLKRRIFTADHCFACTAGAGSSCGGALT